MSAANDTAPPSPASVTAASTPASPAGAPREKSAHAAANATTSARNAAGRLASEVIGHAEAKQVVGDLVRLFEVDEVVDPGGQPVPPRHHAEVVSRLVVGAETGGVEDDPAAVVEGPQTLPVLEEQPVARVDAQLEVASEVVVVLARPS